jgi:hypothetical protein
MNIVTSAYLNAIRVFVIFDTDVKIAWGYFHSWW